MPDINPPTGEEKVQKHYSGPYLNEVDEFKAAVKNAAVTGTELNLEGINPRTIAAVAPQLLSEDEIAALKNATTPGSDVEGNLYTGEGKTYNEANGNDEDRVDAALDNDNNIGINDSSVTGEHNGYDPAIDDSEPDKDQSGVDPNSLENESYDPQKVGQDDPSLILPGVGTTASGIPVPEEDYLEAKKLEDDSDGEQDLGTAADLGPDPDGVSEDDEIDNDDEKPEETGFLNK